MGPPRREEKQLSMIQLEKSKNPPPNSRRINPGQIIRTLLKDEGKLWG